ncbi:fumarase, class II [Methylomagnum ishizawai]|uniref:Fumarate hydratase class II n=1 Tax=Methylomagnum ishizawai TaxID=1760988 RepID=A0A1Y6CXX6_9GAMM|nr:class II fumarate hydratase [Methylomagnum ishizawai]SMF95529.1 fumarase, class II [Methylomagnum ishizawai]
MTATDYRTEQDSMGQLQVPASALYAAQTQRAVENFPISGLTLPPAFIRAVALIKKCAARVNVELGVLDADLGAAIQAAAQEIIEGGHADQFPLDVFQTGSGTSTNMNANEVIATLATRAAGRKVGANDHVNMGQSSNDTIPTAIHVSAAMECHGKLLPALEHLAATLETKAAALADSVKTGRTHLMDAMPITLGQELSGWALQIRNAHARVGMALTRVYKLAQGGTAVGTGINAHPEFAARIADALIHETGLPFTPNDSFFESLGCQDAAVELSGQLKTVAVGLMKIANDLRWMNSGPLAGLGEIELPALQPGSSIMPGKVNPVIPEAACMVAAQVIGNDTTITVAGQSGSFQLNVMLPVIAHNLLQSIELLANVSRLLADKAIAGFVVREDNLRKALALNPILVTALNPVIGYAKAAEIAKAAYKQQRPIIDVAADMTGIPRAELEKLLDPAQLTLGGISA